MENYHSILSFPISEIIVEQAPSKYLKKGAHKTQVIATNVAIT